MRWVVVCPWLLVVAGTAAGAAQQAPASPLSPGAAAADSTSAAARPIPPDAQLEAEGAVIGEISIRVKKIFDPEDPRERHLAYRLVNRLHRTTRDQAVERQLLFRSGDPYSRRVLDESERLLRANRYLSEAVIRPVRYDGRMVDLEVAVQDVWTLNVGFSFGRAGGENATRVYLQDTNLLGTGKQLTLLRSSDVDRTTRQLEYLDRELLGSRFRLDLLVAESDDGRQSAFDFGRPFFALDTRWAMGAAGSTEERVDTFYRLGEVRDRFGHDVERFDLWGGRSRGVVGRRVARWTAGLSYRRDRFRLVEGSVDPALPDRTLAYPWIGYEIQRDTFRETENLDRMGRTEDVALGPRLHARLGLSGPFAGADRTELVFDSNASLGLEPGARGLLLLESALSGRWGSAGLANTELAGSSRYYWRNFGPHELYAGAEGAVVENLDPERQLLLGGDSGLRGYPLRYQEGTARALLTLEQRFFTSWYPLRLVRVGAAVFYDVGRTWGGPADSGYGVLEDIGAGLRLIPTRSGHAAVLHLDVAFPLDGPRDLRSVQWLLKSRTSF